MSEHRGLQFSTVDVFTRSLFKGNQLAIVIIPAGVEPPNQETKQSIAREFNYSETVFLHPATPDTQERRLDIFTASQELPFAGHPVIGTICYVCGSASPPLQNISFALKAGSLLGKYDIQTGQAEAEVPHNVHIHEAKALRKDFIDPQPETKLPADPATDTFPMVSIVQGMTFVLVNVPDIESLSALEPSAQADPDAVLKLDDGWAPSLTATYYYAIMGSSQGGAATRIRSRMFSPRIDEDACTGSAACTLASYLSLQRGGPDVSFAYEIVQGVEMGRAGEIHVTVTLDPTGKAIKQVLLAGTAVTVTSGIIALPPT